MSFRRRWPLCLCVLALTIASCTTSKTNHQSFSDDGGHPGDDAGSAGGLDGGAHVKPDAGSDAGSVKPSKPKAHAVGVPPSYAVADEDYAYRPKASEPTGNAWKVKSGPSGAKVADDGQTVEWTPTKSQKGRQDIEVETKIGNDTVTQKAHVDVAVAEKRAEAEIDENHGGTAIVSSPKSAIQGAAVKADVGAVKNAAKLTISELDNAPDMPGTKGARKAVKFGPDGTVFSAPALISLPLPDDVELDENHMGAFVYDPRGRWQRVQVVRKDLKNHLLYARAPHFSVYMAAQSALGMDLTLQRSASDAVCAGQLVGQASLVDALSAVDAHAVNNASDAVLALIEGGAADLASLLTSKDLAGSFRFVRVLKLLQSSDSGQVTLEEALLVTTLYLPGDGTAHLTHTDALGNVIGTLDMADITLGLDTLAPHLQGAATRALFSTDASGQLALAARMHIVYFEEDASLEPVANDDLGLAVVDVVSDSAAPAAETQSADGDCDHLVGAFDPTDDRLAPQFQVDPAGLAQTMAGSPVRLRAVLVHLPKNATPTVIWSSLLGNGTLANVTGDANARDFSAEVSGRYLIEVRAKVGTQTLSQTFAVDVSPRALPPSCTPAPAVSLLKQGESVALAAVLGDASVPPSTLTIDWGLLVNGALLPTDELVASGESALFTPHFSAAYEIGCRASTRQDQGSLGSTTLSVLAPTQNRLPTDLVLSPPSVTLQVGESLTLVASATDPDGDALTFTWAANANGLGTQTDGAGTSSNSFTSPTPGLFQISVNVADGAGLPQELVAQVLVVNQTSDLNAADADGDGWPVGSGLDCDDTNANVHPGALDKCGDAVDDDCSGSPRTDDCDADGVTAQSGDCNDQDPTVKPGAAERCDGVDNNCDGQVDETFNLSATCSVGVGACATSGKLSCTSDGSATVCNATAGVPSAEICDGIDNNCNGQTDEVFTSTQTTCGVGACLAGGSTSCVRGKVVDSCVPKTGAPDDSLCNGIDDDCNGRVDDGYVSTQTTCGTGACAATGSFACVNGSAVNSCKPLIAAAADLSCDGVDDDCNGQVDDGYVSTPVTCGVGACQNTGASFCVQGAVVPKCAALQPTLLVDANCNGIDDDCDGHVDEDFVALPEVCNGLDDNCNGTADEGLTCAVASNGPCTPTGSEICNGLDDDCNGQIDENVCNLTPVDGSIVGVWWKCTDASCGALKSSGMMFVAGGMGHDLSTFDGLPYAPASGPYCADANQDFQWSVQQGQITFSFVDQGVTKTGVGVLTTQGARATIDVIQQPAPNCPASGPSKEICGDGIDEDCDSCDDQDDPDCGGSGCDVLELVRVPEQPGGACPQQSGGGGSCQPEVCNNGKDDDCDGCVDTVDVDCGGTGCKMCQGNCGPTCTSTEICGNGTNDDCDQYALDSQDPDCLPSCAQDPSQSVCNAPGETCLDAIALGQGTAGLSTDTGARDDLSGPGFANNAFDRVFWFDLPTSGAEIILSLNYATGQANQSPVQASLYQANGWQPGQQCPPMGSTAYWSIYGGQKQFNANASGGRYLLVVEGGFQQPFTLEFAYRPTGSTTCSLPDGDADGITVCDRDCDDGNAQVHPANYYCDPNASCTQIPAATELCDGLDNDCDGMVDNVGGACATNLPGVCAQGVHSCGTDAVTNKIVDLCTPSQQSPREYCGDGLDNDCDGKDETQEACVSAAGEICGVTALPMGLGGTFHGSLANASDDAQSICYGPGADLFYSFTLSNPSQVHFNAKNQPGYGVGYNFHQDCSLSASSCGFSDSNYMQPGTYYFSVERNGTAGDGSYGFSMWLADSSGNCLTPDNDGDGISLCAGDCDDSNAQVHPAGQDGNGKPIPAGSEGASCDQLDNDCNGTVDDLGFCTVTDPGFYGVCAQGQFTCSGGTQPICQSITGSAPQSLEICDDGLDNDCNPSTADSSALKQCTAPGVPGETCGDAIDMGQGGVFNGTLINALDNALAGCEPPGSPEQYFKFTLSEQRMVTFSLTQTSGSTGTGSSKGGTGLAFSVMGVSCSSRETLQCSGGQRQQTLSAGSYFVAVYGAPVNYTLEYYSVLPDGTMCLPDLADDGDGYSICGGDCDPNNAAVHPGAAEYCDGVDNNCNGMVDENAIIEQPGSCVDATKVGECQHGNWSCQNGGVVCSGSLPTQELCADGKDNDCNGLTDETGCATPTGADCPAAIPTENSALGTITVNSVVVDTRLNEGEFQGRITDPKDDAPGCGGVMGTPEMVYSFVAPASGFLFASVHAADGLSSPFSLRSSEGNCAGPDYCHYSNNVSPRPMVGGTTYYLTVEGPMNQDFLLTFAFRSGSDPYTGTCFDGLNGAGNGDFDADGASLCNNDCNEANPSVHPGAQEICNNGVDDNCDGAVDNCGTQCACNLQMGACDASCACDPDCGTSCGCNLIPGSCEAGCACDPDCGVKPICGNHIIEPPEVCDDGNTVGGDGCNATCSGP